MIKMRLAEERGNDPQLEQHQKSKKVVTRRDLVWVSLALARIVALHLQGFQRGISTLRASSLVPGKSSDDQRRCQSPGKCTGLQDL